MLVPDPPAKSLSAERVNLQQALKLALSLVLFYAFALTVNWDVANYGSLAIVLVSLGTRGASLQKGILRVVGTTAGVVVGYCIVAAFAQDRWGALIAMSIYLAFVSYAMQTSRFGYAWFVTGFVPLVIWGDNYPDFGNAFYFGTFRWLETTAGILIYTIVDMLLWPRHAGDQFRNQRIELWSEIGALTENYRRCLNESPEETSIAAHRAKMAGAFAGVTASLEQASIDTPAVRGRRSEWQEWVKQTASFLSSLELWYESIIDCKKYDLQQDVRSLVPILKRLEDRLALIERIEQQGAQCIHQDSRIELREATTPLPINELAEPRIASLTATQRPVFQCFVDHLRSLDRSSQNILRLLVDMPSQSDEADHVVIPALQPAEPEAKRWIAASFPSIVFALSFVMWILINPPAGQKVPMMAAIFSLMVVLNRINPIPLVVLMVVSTLFVVAPVYWLIMPRLESGEALLVMVFCFAFLFGYLGGKNPAFKMGPMIMFVNMTGISNEQSYSFRGPVDGAMMTIMAGLVVAAVYVLYRTMRGEVIILTNVRQFFRGCSSVAAMYHPSAPEEAASPTASTASRQRLRYLQANVLPIPARIRSAQKVVNEKLVSAVAPEQLEELSNGLQSLADRLQTLEWQIAKTRRTLPQIESRLSSLIDEIRRDLEDQFKELARLPDLADTSTVARASSGELRAELEQVLQRVQDELAKGQIDEQSATSMFALVGSVRGLVESLDAARQTMVSIHWAAFSQSRF